MEFVIGLTIGLVIGFVLSQLFPSLNKKVLSLFVKVLGTKSIKSSVNNGPYRSKAAIQDMISEELESFDKSDEDDRIIWEEHGHTFFRYGGEVFAQKQSLREIVQYPNIYSKFFSLTSDKTKNLSSALIKTRLLMKLEEDKQKLLVKNKGK